jgi:hypothetical protein
VHDQIKNRHAKKSDGRQRLSVMSTCILFKDDIANTEIRRNVWRNAKFLNLSEKNVPASSKYLLLLHAGDVVAALVGDGGRSNVGSVENCLRLKKEKNGSRLAILYFSGGGPAFQVLKSYGAIETDFVHYYARSTDKEEPEFAKRVEAVGQLWINPLVPPDWQLLYRTWRDSAREFAAAVRLLSADNMKLRAFLSQIRSEGHPFDSQGMEKANAEVGEVGDAAKKVHAALALDLGHDDNREILRRGCAEFLQTTMIDGDGS